jgi:hypothetical protein
MKKFKTYASFRSAIAQLVSRKKHDSISPVCVRLGYAIKEERGSQVIFKFADGLHFDQSDVEKIASQINRI